MTINWNISKRDALLIEKIVNRAVDVARAAEIEYTRQMATMDITAVHLNDCRLDLQRLLEADSFNFDHDIFGIRRHLNRTTGKLEDWFHPRSAAPIAPNKENS